MLLKNTKLDCTHSHPWLGLVILLITPMANAQIGIFANGFEPRRFCNLADGAAVCPGFTVSAPDLPLLAGNGETRSFYFRTPNTVPLAVRRLSAVRDSSVQQLQWTLTVTGTGTATECRPPGTFEVGACCESQSSAMAIPMLTALRPFDDQWFDATDANGTTLALELAPNTPVCLQYHAFNATTEPTTARVQVAAEAQLPALPYVSTAPFLALTSQINIPAGSNGNSITHACATRPTAKFWSLTTRTFRQGVEARLQRGLTMLLVNTDWEAPQTASFVAPSFIDFDNANLLSTTCTYDNPSGQTINYGQNPNSDETCEASGYFFPSSTPSMCINGVQLF